MHPDTIGQVFGRGIKAPRPFLRTHGIVARGAIPPCTWPVASSSSGRNNLDWGRDLTHSLIGFREQPGNFSPLCGDTWS